MKEKRQGRSRGACASRLHVGVYHWVWSEWVLGRERCNRLGDEREREMEGHVCPLARWTGD